MKSLVFDAVQAIDLAKDNQLTEQVVIDTRYNEWLAGVNYLLLVEKIKKQAVIAEAVGATTQAISAIVRGVKRAGVMRQDRMSVVLGFTKDEIREVGRMAMEGKSISKWLTKRTVDVGNMSKEANMLRHLAELHRELIVLHQENRDIRYKLNQIEKELWKRQVKE